MLIVIDVKNNNFTDSIPKKGYYPLRFVKLFLHEPESINNVSRCYLDSLGIFKSRKISAIPAFARMTEAERVTSVNNLKNMILKIRYD